MPLNNKPSAENTPIEQDAQVKTAKAAVHKTLNRFEANMNQLADKIESTQVVKAVTVSWPILKTSMKATRFVRRNPWVLIATGVAMGCLFVYRYHKSSTSKMS